MAGLWLFYSLLYPQVLEECLTHSRHYLNNNCMTGMSDAREENAKCYSGGSPLTGAETLRAVAASRGGALSSCSSEEKESFYSVITIEVNCSSPQHPLPSSPNLFTGRHDPVFYILSSERFHHWLKARQGRLVSRPSDNSRQIRGGWGWGLCRCHA